MKEGAGGTVAAMTVPGILDEAGLDECDLLKLDVEGAEARVLENIETWGRRIGTIVCELHEGTGYDWFAATVRRAGFEPRPAGTLFRGLPGAVRRLEAQSRGTTPSD